MTNVGRRPTIRDVADRAGVSKSLVSLVLHDSPNVSDKRREAVMKAMSELGYKPNLNARNLVRMRSATVGVVISDMLNPWCVDFLDGFDAQMREAGFNVLLGNGRLRAEVQSDLMETFLEYGVAGLCLGGTFGNPGDLQRRMSTVPTVAVHNLELEGPAVDTVANDYADGAARAVEHLVSGGHACIAHITGAGGVAEERRVGFDRAIVANGLHAHSVVSTDFSPEGNAEAAHAVLTSSPRPTAIFAVNDLVGLAVMDTARALGLRIPRDLAVVGCDNTRFASLPQVSMSSIDNLNVAMGQEAAMLLLDRIAHPSRPPVHRRMGTSLIVRSSSGRPLA